MDSVRLTACGSQRRPLPTEFKKKVAGVWCSHVLGLDLRMSRRGLNGNDCARHELNSRQPAWMGSLTGPGSDDAIGPVLVGPVSERAHAIVLGERKFRIARLKTKFGDLSKLDTHRGWRAGSNRLCCNGYVSP